MLFSFACNYFISSYFVSLGTRTLDSVFYLIFGQFVLGLTISSLILLITCLSNENGILSELMAAMPSPSFIEPMCVTYLFASLALRNFQITVLETIVRIVSCTCFLSLGSFLGWYMLFGKKDPSGEYAGKGIPINVYTSLYPHFFAAVVGFFMATFIGATASYGIVIIAPIFFILWAATYYFSIVLINGGFHFNSKNWIISGGVTLTIVVLTILVYFI
ncbi:MAG TPA: hypothetical protein DDW18_02440 [Firmicutes bacterium]|nr:hypothetical protein [Bacillota bacterium]